MPPFSLISLKTEAARTPKTSENFYQTTWNNSQETSSYSKWWKPENSPIKSVFAFLVSHHY
jgi:hypothetical protein